jgi:hypothetical protein
LTSKMTIFKLYNFFSHYFRPRRMNKFSMKFGLSEKSRILDVGGSEFNWELLPHRYSVTFLNLPIRGCRPSTMPYVIGDGRYLPFGNGAFDIVFSNSVIEHLGNFEDQLLFASECRRVGRRYYIQTPDKKFFIEPHFITPFFHWLPHGIQKLMLRNFTLWGLMSRPTDEQCTNIHNEIRLLDKRELQMIFPDADIWHERFCGMSKSLIAAKSLYK